MILRRRNGRAVSFLIRHWRRRSMSLPRTALLKCQFYDLMEYVAAAQKHRCVNYSLHQWMKATIENLVKKEKACRTSTLCVEDREVYAQ
jgi:hypothetical protein